MARYSPPYANVPTESEAVDRDVSAINLEVWLRWSNFLVDADEVAALGVVCGEEELKGSAGRPLHNTGA